MGFSMLMCMKTRVPLLDFSPCKLNMNDLFNSRRHREKIVILMGATGTGKSRLSIDLATRFAAEIINSDKMQAYEGLPIATNKVTEEEQRGVPHHLLGILNPDADFTATDFCDRASLAVESILGRDRLPLIVGGSNSYIEALIDDDDYMFRSKYECCFLWVDVSMPVLHSFVSNRVDQMVENGLVDEVRKLFDPAADYSRGIRRAIGVPEFDQYFRTEPFLDKHRRLRLLHEAITQMKENTCKLACRQLGKILRLRNKNGWNMHRIDATEVFQKHGGKEADEAWMEHVAGPSNQIVEHFLYNFAANVPANVPAGMKVRSVGTAIAAATY
ncbi:adenylate isopentenyltransferase 3, chloroplastic [Corylus avellana]|uniref:adenylate isopentenyltransferase 3, chloroplastic n=1 Tax=Corylus avellana TaxID=13451 RepID=UPI001E20388B|nr:adenylate isopentenyltransferase 3, chloroplastic [Corylus avellana]